MAIYGELVTVKIIVGLLALIGLAVVICICCVLFKSHRKIKLYEKPRVFDDALELVEFIRTVYECKLENKVILYGFVDTVFQDDTLYKSGLAEKQHLDVDVFIITNGEKLEVSAICNNLNANLNKGDFVGVLPLYNQRHNLWTYVLVAKLDPVYLGKNRGFKVGENYIEN